MLRETALHENGNLKKFLTKEMATNFDSSDRNSYDYAYKKFDKMDCVLRKNLESIYHQTGK